MRVTLRGVFVVTLLVVLAPLGAGCESDCPDNPSPPDARADAGRDLGPSGDVRADAPPSGGWAISVSGTGTDGIEKVIVDPSGNLVVAGWFSGTVSFGSKTLTASAGSTFVGKLDKTGKWLWAVPLDGVVTSKSKHWDGLAVDASGNIYYAGELEGSATFGSTTLTSKGKEDISVVKLDSSGNVLWAVSAGGTGDDGAETIAVGSDGKLTLAGAFAGTASFGSTTLTASGPDDLYVARLDSSGAFSWAVQAGSAATTTYGDRATALLLDSSGNTFIAGFVGPSATFGTLSLAGRSNQNTAFAAKLDATGKFLWVWSSEAATFANAIARGASGGLYINSTVELAGRTGSLSSLVAPMVSKVSDDGASVWSTLIPCDQWMHAGSLLVDAKGEVTLAGSFKGTALFGSTVLTSKGTGNNPFLAHLDSSGKVTGAEHVPTTGGGNALGLARDPSGSLYFTGQFDGTMTFNGTSLTSKNNDSDGYLWNRGQSKP